MYSKVEILLKHFHNNKKENNLSHSKLSKVYFPVTDFWKIPDRNVTFWDEIHCFWCKNSIFQQDIQIPTVQ